MRATYAALFTIAIALRLAADCGVERWPVKTASDDDVSRIGVSVIPITIVSLRGVSAPRPLPQATRVAPIETTIYSVTATLVDFRRDDDGDDYLVLADEAGRTIVAEIPAGDCLGANNSFSGVITAARQAFEARFNVSAAFQHVALPVEVRGVGFFDYLQDQRGAAPNGVELHPVIGINFNPFFVPSSPAVGRRRAVGTIGSSTCSRPTLTLRATRTSVCATETTALTWQSSDPAATVSIDGVGSALPANGSTAVSVSSSTAYSGHASNTCGPGAEAVAVINVTTGASASVNASPNAISSGGSATISVSVSNAASWTLSSSLGNPLSPSSGNSNALVSYSGSHSGTDTITLSATGSCGAIQRATSIVVNAPPTPTPPPVSGGLLCCDGTRSPSCFSCANKSGCCSSHKGVCGCP